MEAELLRNTNLLFMIDFSFITCIILCIKNTSSATSAFPSSVAKCMWKQCRTNKIYFYLFHNWKTACGMFNRSSLSWRCTFNCAVDCMYFTLWTLPRRVYWMSLYHVQRSSCCSFNVCSQKIQHYSGIFMSLLYSKQYFTTNIHRAGV